MKRPVWILHVFVVGLALHNFVMAELYAAGVRGTALDVVSAWKEVLLAVGLVLVWRNAASLRFQPALVDWLALAYGAFVVALRRCSRSACSAAARPTTAWCSASATTCCRSRRTSSAAAST